MSSFSTKAIVGVVVALIVIAVLMPMALGLLGNAGSQWIVLNSTHADSLADLVDPAIITILTVLLPILAIVGIALGFISTRE